MATVFETRPQTAFAPVREEEALRHNALIKERYKQLLQNAEEDQLSESISRAEKAPVASYPTRASVLAPERPAEKPEQYFAPAQAPAENVTVHERVNSPLFTPETLDRTIRESGFAPAVAEPETDVFAAREEAFRPADMPAAYELPEVRPMPVAAVNAEAAVDSYGLRAFAMKMIAAFAAAVIMLLTIIGINSYVISQKAKQLKNLEQKRQQLEEKNAELEARIEEATSYEKVLEFVKENGMILDEN